MEFLFHFPYFLYFCLSIISFPIRSYFVNLNFCLFHIIISLQNSIPTLNFISLAFSFLIISCFIFKLRIKQIIVKVSSRSLQVLNCTNTYSYFRKSSSVMIPPKFCMSRTNGCNSDPSFE